MDGSIIERMREEEADLERKLKAVRDFLTAYDGDRQPSERGRFAVVTRPTPMPVTNARENGRARGKVGIDGYSDYGRMIVATALSFMVESLDPIRTRAVVDGLEAMGVEISGESKINAVGALLSRSADVVSHGKSGWTAADDNKAREIAEQYARKRNEPPTSDAGGGSDAEEAPTSSNENSAEELL